MSHWGAEHKPLLQKCGAGDEREGKVPAQPPVPRRARGHTVSSTGPAKAKGASAPQTGCPVRHCEEASSHTRGLGGTTWAPSLLETSDL